MLADLYECDVKTLSSKEGPALGIAILAAVGQGFTITLRRRVTRLLRLIRYAVRIKKIRKATKSFMVFTIRSTAI